LNTWNLPGAFSISDEYFSLQIKKLTAWLCNQKTNTFFKGRYLPIYTFFSSPAIAWSTLTPFFLSLSLPYTHTCTHTLLLSRNTNLLAFLASFQTPPLCTHTHTFRRFTRTHTHYLCNCIHTHTHFSSHYTHIHTIFAIACTHTHSHSDTKKTNTNSFFWTLLLSIISSSND